MKRFLGFVALAASVSIIAGPTIVRAQDKVERRDKKAGSVFVSGKILEENAAGVRIKPQGLGKEQMIPSNEIIHMSYSDMPARVALDIGKLAPAEAARDYAALLKGYEAVQVVPELRSSGAAARRYIDYRVVSLRAAVADGDEQLKAAEKGLSNFMNAHPDTWEYPLVARQLAHLQADAGDYAAATRTYETLEKASNVPSEFKQDAAAALIDIAFQSEDYDAGQRRIEAVRKDPMTTPVLKARVDMYQLGLDAAKGDLAASVKKIEDAINKTEDSGLKALGYNVLGDVYLAKGQPREAMWSYLWVDVVYNHDRGEHVKAMTRLIKIFEKDNDKAKVVLYKEKLARSR